MSDKLAESPDSTNPTLGANQLPEPAGRPLVRRGIAILLVVTLISIAALAHFWDEVTVWRQRGRAAEYFRTHRDSEALSQLRTALLTDLDNPSTIVQLARAHRRLGDLEKAAMLLDASINFGADADQVDLERKLIAVQAGQIRGFDKQLPNLIIEAADNASDILQAYVLGLFANLRTEEAFALLEGWESSSPRDPQPKFLQAYLYQGINRLPEAAEAYRQGLQIAPHSTLMRRRLAHVLLDDGQWQAAQQELEICRREAPDDVEVIYLLAQCAFAADNATQALDELNRVLDQIPGHLGALLLRGQIRLAAGDPQAALADLHFVVGQQPTDIVAREALGRALQLVGRADEAKPHFDFVTTVSKEQAETVRLIRQVISEPDNVELRYEIGRRLFAYGAPQDGVNWMRTVLEIQPQHAGALAALAGYYQRQGEPASVASNGDPSAPDSIP